MDFPHGDVKGDKDLLSDEEPRVVFENEDEISGVAMLPSATSPSEETNISLGVTRPCPRVRYQSTGDAYLRRDGRDIPHDSIRRRRRVTKRAFRIAVSVVPDLTNTCTKRDKNTFKKTLYRGLLLFFLPPHTLYYV